MIFICRGLKCLARCTTSSWLSCFGNNARHRRSGRTFSFFSCFHVVYLFVLFFLVMCLHDKVSKCYYDGDFTVMCNKSRLPSSSSSSNHHQSHHAGGDRKSSGGGVSSKPPSSSSDAPIELMHYARVINGMQHQHDNNGSICSYQSGSSTCARKRTLTECLDKPECYVKNSWSSLEPDCPGNSYYTQFEYDCQPAYFMCDDGERAPQLARNVFSALVYSPNYPRSFRTDKPDQLCFLTLYFPSHHHVEINLEYFDLLPTSQCIGDFLEIRQYIPATSSSSATGVKKRHRRGAAANKKFSNSTSSTGAFLKGTNGVVKVPKNPKTVASSKAGGPQQQQEQSSSSSSRRGQREQGLRWEQLGVMCGIVDSTYTIRASSNIVNFKFRPLPSNHQFFARNTVTRENMGFKIFVQAIPPVPHAAATPPNMHGPAAATSPKSPLDSFLNQSSRYGPTTLLPLHTKSRDSTRSQTISSIINMHFSKMKKQ